MLESIDVHLRDRDAPITIVHAGAEHAATIGRLAVQACDAWISLSCASEIAIGKGTTLAVRVEDRVLDGHVYWQQTSGATQSFQIAFDELAEGERAALVALAEHLAATHALHNLERRLGRPPAPRPAIGATHAALLAEVLANPDDDQPRLVLADWLSERDDPRGQFITVQCTLAGRGADAKGPDIDELRAREEALLKKHKKKWVGEFAGTRIEHRTGSKTYVKGSPTKWHFKRGFVDTVELGVDDYARNATALFACEPVRCIHLTRGDLIEFLESSPELHRIRALDLRTWKLRDSDLQALAQTTSLTAMERLDLGKCRIGVKAMTVFAKHALERAALRVLDLWWNSIGDKGAVALAGSPILRNLRELELCNNGIGASGGLALAESPYLDNIEHLSLWANTVGAEATRALRARFGSRLMISDKPG